MALAQRITMQNRYQSAPNVPLARFLEARLAWSGIKSKRSCQFVCEYMRRILYQNACIAK